MQRDPEYQDVVAEVAGYLGSRREVALRAGIPAGSIVLDPGIGFGKSARHNLELLAGTPALALLGAPLLVGVSRKSFLAGPQGDPPSARLPAGLAAAAIAVFLGARLVRAHDVAVTRRALAVADAMRAVRDPVDRGPEPPRT
jgi:dihydropteroate synthase